jgi:hypothetical protein
MNPEAFVGANLVFALIPPLLLFYNSFEPSFMNLPGVLFFYFSRKRKFRNRLYRRQPGQERTGKTAI